MKNPYKWKIHTHRAIYFDNILNNKLKFQSQHSSANWSILLGYYDKNTYK